MRIPEKLFIRAEMTQLQEEGCDTDKIQGRVDAALAKGRDIDPAEISALYDELSLLKADPGFPYDEPSEYESIRALRPDGPRSMEMDLTDEALKDRIYGAWLGRAAGCTLGKPVEGWSKERIDTYLKTANALPLDNYIPYVEDRSDDLLTKGSTRGHISYMERDDDMDYTVLGLLILEYRGMHFTPRGMAHNWLDQMAYSLVCTAENAAYRNFVGNLWPPESATCRNPYREWIGAQIRADIFGYVTPGWPEKGAELAFRDASISHVKNGIYGEMFVAAMLSAALVTTDMDRIIAVGLSEIPADCRLAEAVRDTVAWCREESNWEQVWDRIREKYGHYSAVHTINNAALVAMGLLFGAEDFETGIVVAVRGGWDTDCNGATVGSILGATFGAKALPDKWIGVLNDRLLSSVRDCTDSKISDLAERTYQVTRTILEEKAVAGTADDRSGSELVGSWKLSGQKYSAVFPPTLIVNSDLTGRLEDAESGEILELPDMKFQDNIVSFGLYIEKGGWVAEMTFEGLVSGDGIRGDIYSFDGGFPVTGVRA